MDSVERLTQLEPHEACRVVARDSLTNPVVDIRLVEKAPRRGGVLVRVVDREQDMVGAERGERRDQRSVVALSGSGHEEIALQIVRRLECE
jgi:hypothetical protein